MASNVFTQTTIDGVITMRRSIKQGRKPSGLGKPKLIRLFQDDEDWLMQLKEILGEYYNENEIIRTAVHNQRSIYTELIKQ